MSSTSLSKKYTPHVYIFDVDGPLSDPKERRVTKPQIIEELAAMLERGDVVALNTGRSIEWLLRGPKPLDGADYPMNQKGLIDLLDERVHDKSLFHNFYAVGEKGGSELRYVHGEWKTFTDPEITVPLNLQEEVGRIIREEGYESTMFFDDTKRTMISSEMNPLPDGLTDDEKHEALTAFHKKQEELLMRLKPLMKERGLLDHFKIDPTAIATDIEAKGVGKDFGARKILRWIIEELHLDPQLLHVYAVGDSGSDVPMANELDGKVGSVRFIFVGDPGKPSNKEWLAKTSVSVHCTHAKDSAGTLEFLDEQMRHAEATSTP